MSTYKRRIVIITIIITIIEIIAIFYLINKLGIKIDEIIELTNLFSAFVPIPIACLINYYIISPVLYHCLLFLWHILGHYNYKKESYKKIMKWSISWFSNINNKWGPEYNSVEPQNANCCEVLISYRTTNFYEEKRNLYNEVLQGDILNNVTETGLPSKSLKKSTIMCTSLLLKLLSFEKMDKTSSVSDFSFYDGIAVHLWNVRNDLGWGVYTEKAPSDECSFANTFRVLESLLLYKCESISNNQLFDYIKSIYEYSSDGKFGFFIGDQHRLATTAMYLLLFYEINPEQRKQLSKIYNYKKAIEYVYKKFVNDNIQCETETLVGIDRGQSGAKKAPWVHISSGFAIEALILAYQNKDINILKTNMLFNKIDELLKKDVKYDNDNQTCYYVPNGIRSRRGGVFTYPTTYLINGLSRLL